MFNIFNSKAKQKNETKVLLASLYSMLLADDKVSDEEREYFRNFWKQKGFTQREISDVINQHSKLSSQVPTERQKQAAFFADIVALAMVDGVISHTESEHLAKYAKMMSLADTDDKIQALIEEVVKQQKGL